MWVLEEVVPEARICAKILRSLPERFNTKVTVIEEIGDIDQMMVEELVGSVQTFEMQFDNIKSKSIALKSSSSKSKNKGQSSSDDEDKEDMALFVKKFSKHCKGKRISNMIKARIKLNQAPQRVS